MKLHTKITCPNCGNVTEETMPEDQCIVFYECPKCHTTLKPNPGDCCVFCSFADEKCPPKQREKES